MYGYTRIQRFDADAKWISIGMSTGLTCGIKFIVIAGVCMNLKCSDVDNDRDNKTQLRSMQMAFIVKYFQAPPDS